VFAAMTILLFYGLCGAAKPSKPFSVEQTVFSRGILINPQ